MSIDGNTERNGIFWKTQIRASKEEHKKFFQEAKNCNEAYSKERSYNIFYSNTQVLTANLLPNMPKPDIQRRFLKKTESEKLKYNTYLEVAKVSEGCVQYYSDIGKFFNKFKTSIDRSVKIGRGVDWVEYNPTVEKDEEGNKFIKDRELKVISLDYEEFLCSSAKTEEDVWWVARRHLLTKEEIEERFEYEFSEGGTELNFEDKNSPSVGTSKKRGEVWEIWDKTSKSRSFVLMSSIKSDTLETTEDPYKLQNFFPCEDISWLNNGKDIIPIPEYRIYRKKAVELDSISALSDNLEGVIKYVLTTDSANKDTASELANAVEGDMLEVKEINPTSSKQASQAVGMIPIDGAIQLALHREDKKTTLKNDIYEITGISDIQRGVSDSKETATAQKIKGVFGSMRFQDRQKKIQEHIKNVYQIITEIICEHWDEKTMSEITCTYLPTEEEKQFITYNLQQEQAIQQNPQMQQAIQNGMMQAPQQITEDQIKKLDDPTWDDVLKIMREDKLRNYTIDIETSSTVYDDIEQQNASVLALNQSYQQVITSAAQLQDPSLIKGYIPIAKMILTNLKVGRAMSKQLVEALETSARELETKQKQAEQNPQPNPEMIKVQLEQKKLELETADKQSQIQERNMKAQKDLLSEQNKSREIALKEQEAMAKINIENKKLMQDNMSNVSDINQGNRGLDIQQQEADRKDNELQLQTIFRSQQIEKGQSVNPNLAGDVNSLA